MTTELLSKRITHKYVGTYKHLDDWDDIGSITITRRRELPVGDDDDIYEPRSFMYCTEVHSDAAPADVEQAIRDTYTRAGCGHEYDCCGCRSYYVADVKHIVNRRWRFVLNSYRNY